MPDDLTNRGPQDRSRISLLEPHEVQYWADKFDVSKERLSEAVKNVGHSAAAVEKELKKLATPEEDLRTASRKSYQPEADLLRSRHDQNPARGCVCDRRDHDGGVHDRVPPLHGRGAEYRRSGDRLDGGRASDVVGYGAQLVSRCPSMRRARGDGSRPFHPLLGGGVLTLLTSTLKL